MGEVVKFSGDKPAPPAETMPAGDDWAYDDRRKCYWRRTERGDWISHNETQARRVMRQLGLSPQIDYKAGEVVSPLEARQIEIEQDARVYYAGGLAGWQAGRAMSMGRDILVTTTTEVLPPREPTGPRPEAVMDFAGWGFPTLGAFLAGLLNGVEYDEASDGREEIVQLPLFLCWLQHFYRSLLERRYSTGLALALAGEPESGKTLLSSLVQTITGGIVARPYRYMIGADNFNEEWVEAPLLVVDDENSDTHIQSRLKFGAEMKQIVASRGTRIRGMHQAAVTLQPIQRLLICVNVEPERLQVLPPIDADIRDKILVMKGYAKPMPMPAATVGEQERFWIRLTAELPFFLWWLCEVWEPAPEMLGRFGCKAWQHPEILSELGKLSPEARTAEFIDRLFEHCRPSIGEADLPGIAVRLRERLAPHIARHGSVRGWIGSATQLRERLVRDGEEAPLSMHERREVRPAPYLARDLHALARQFPETVWTCRTPGGGKAFVLLSEPLPEEVSP